MTDTGFIWHEKLMWHDNGAAAGLQPVRGDLQPGVHMENAETKRRLKNLLDAYGVTPQLTALPFEAATDAHLLQFHTQQYIDFVQQLSDGMGGDAGHAAIVGPGSAEIAKLAAGGTAAAIAAVANGQVANAYALSRPPGHHAERERGRGFCIFNNIALGVMAARAQASTQRVAILDWDVHHGNGTQQAFYDRADVLAISIHQEMLYPANMGMLEEIGEGAGEGFNINVPLPAGCGGAAYLLAMEQVALPALAAFQPDLLVIACGYDAAYFDPSSHMLLVANHFRQMARMVLDFARTHCDGRIVINHEGGYSDFYVPLCGMAVIEELTGIDSGVRDPYAGTEHVANQTLRPHQAEAVQAAIDGPLANLLERTR